MAVPVGKEDQVPLLLYIPSFREIVEVQFFEPEMHSKADTNRYIDSGRGLLRFYLVSAPGRVLAPEFAQQMR